MSDPTSEATNLQQLSAQDLPGESRHLYELINSNEKSRSGKALSRKLNNRVDVLTSPKKQVTLGSFGELSVPAQNTRSPANQNRDKSLASLQPISRQLFPADSNHKSSSVFGTGQSTNVKVVIRVRPVNEREKTSGQSKSCIQVEDDTKITLDRGADTKNFTFDYVASQETSQEQIFQKIAQPIADCCLQGYNGTIFAYGQTGSGKTYTIQGPTFTSEAGHEQIISAQNSTGAQFEQRGLMQRSFEHIFSRIEQEKQEAEANGSEIKFLIKSSYLEIYNEQVMDLLDPSAQNLHVREDIKTGVYVEGLLEEPISSVKDMIQLIQRGSRNRHVGSTSMNKESSRSHSVLTTIIESKTMQASGVWQLKSSCFHIIDLAGSERSKHTHAEGQRLKEAGMINKSLSALGIVINSLVDISEGKTRHVHYRDSKLTFLLRDSLGGNSKTVIIANITQAQVSMAETLSTLAFAQRAKLIKNKAVINEESSGTIQILKGEIRRLKQEIAEMSQKVSQPTIDDTICKLCKAVSQSGQSDVDEKYADEMLVEKRPSASADTCQMAMRIVKLENLLAANLENLTSNHKYFEAELEKKNQSLKRFKTALDQLDKQAQRDKMVIKFRDQRIQKLEETVAQKFPQDGCTTCSFKDELIEKLTKEKDNLQQLYEKQTSSLAAKLFAEKEELKGLNETYLKELHQTPESLTAQLRNYSELTDNLSQYIKEHCNEPQRIQDLQSEKHDLLSQISELQETLDQTHMKSEAALIKSQEAHRAEIESLQQLLRAQSKSHAAESAQLKQDAQAQIAQIKQDLKALSESEASHAQQQIAYIERQNDFQSTIVSLQHQLSESEQTQIKTNNECTQLLDKIASLQSQLCAEQDDSAARIAHMRATFAADKESLLLKLKVQHDASDREISDLQKALMAEQARTDALLEAEESLQNQVSQLEKLSESLTAQLIQEQESLKDARQEVSEGKIQLALISSQLEKLDQKHSENLASSQAALASQRQKHESQIKSLEESHSQNLNEHRVQLMDLKTELEAKIQQLTEHHESELDSVKQTKSQEIAALNSQLNDVTHALQTAKGELTASEAVQNQLSSEVDDLALKNSQLSSQLVTQQTQIFQLTEQLSVAQQTCREMRSQLHASSIESESEMAALSQELSTLKNEYIKQIQLSDRLQADLAATQHDCKAKLEQSQAAMSRSQREHDESLAKATAEHETQIASVQLQHSQLSLQLQQTVNKSKQIELERMSMEAQLLKHQQEADAQRQQYQTRLEQIEATVRSTLELEKRACQEELHAQYQQQMATQQQALHSSLQSDYMRSLREIETANQEKVQSLNAEHRHQMEHASIKHHDDMRSLRSHLNQKFASKLTQVLHNIQSLKAQLSVLKQLVPAPFNLATVSDAVEKIQELHNQRQESSRRAQEEELGEAWTKINDLSSQLTDYKGLTKQLQTEKQAQINSARVLSDQLLQAEDQLRTCLEIHETELSELKQSHSSELRDVKASLEASKQEIDRLRDQNQESCADLAKQKQKSQELAQQLRNSKNTIAGLVEKESALMDDLEGRMGEIGISQDKWKQKVSDQKREIQDLKAKFDTLMGKYEIVVSSRDQLINSHEVQIQTNEEEFTALKLQLKKRETEIKEVVRTLKKYSDDKKALEAELAKRVDTSEGHQNLSQKIQHHLKIKEENNKLREENFTLKEEIRRKIDKPEEQSRRDCLMMVESFESVCEKAIQLPGSVQFLNQVPQMTDVWRRASTGATTSQQAAINCKQKAAVVNELLSNAARLLAQVIQQDSAQQKQLVTPSYKVTQPSQGQITQPRIGSAQARSSHQIEVKQISARPPVPNQTKQPLEKENKVHQAASFLHSIQQRNNSHRKHQ